MLNVDEAQLLTEIKKAAIKNAVEYGKAQESTVSGKVLSKAPELKNDMSKLHKLVSTIVNEVNSMGKVELESEYKKYEVEFTSESKEKKEKTAKPKLELKDIKGTFITRFPPEPNGYLQIGHAKAVLMEQTFARKYNGSIILYFDDTNPEKEEQRFVDAIKEDLKWLGVTFDKEYYASDNIGLLYKYAETMIREGNAYVCMCDAEKMRSGRADGYGCVHKTHTTERNLELWGTMLSRELDEGTATLRLNGDMSAENTMMRDPTLFRIKYSTHYRQGDKYAIWPTYNFNTPVNDSLNGVTDAIRSKEFELEDELYFKILDMLQLRKPRIHTIARLEIKNNLTSKRKINELIREKYISGYDDPRLVTITALKRRGILPGAIKEFALRFGMSKTNSKVSIDMLLAENRKLIDKNSKRLSCVEEPMELIVNDIPESEKNKRVKLHPLADIGYKKYNLNSVFFINTTDASNLKIGDTVRLKGAFSVRVTGVTKDGMTGNFAGDEMGPAIQWINKGDEVACKLLRIGDLLINDKFNKDSLSVTNCYVEGYSKSLENGEVVQFERIGFFKLDDKSTMSFLSL